MSRERRTGGGARWLRSKYRYRSTNPDAFCCQWLHADSLADVRRDGVGCELPVEIQRRDRSGTYQPAGQLVRDGKKITYRKER
jgi:hypothetical protein